MTLAASATGAVVAWQSGGAPRANLSASDSEKDKQTNTNKEQCKKVGNGSD